MPATLSLNLIGAGRLGQTLAYLWRKQSLLKVNQLLTQSPTSATAAVEFIGSGNACHDINEMSAADLWLIATPDGSIPAVIETLRQSNLIKPGNIVFHCSGALSSEELQPLADIGARIASVHPIHSFASATSSVNDFSGSHCACEGDNAALAQLKPLFTSIGGQCFTIEQQNKSLYHAASVMACNYLVTLLEASRETFAIAGISEEQANQLMAPIVHQTADNLFNNSAADVLTGPIARGDVKTVQKQLDKLSEEDGELANLYRSLGVKTVAIARQQLSSQNQARLDQLKQIEALLNLSK